MKNPDDDVDISNGHGFLVTRWLYEEHLSVAKELKEVGWKVPYIQIISDKTIRHGPVMTMRLSTEQTSFGIISFGPASGPGHVQDMDVMSLIP